MVLSAIISSAAFKFVYPEVQDFVSRNALDAFGETLIYFAVILVLWDVGINTDDDSLDLTGYVAAGASALVTKAVLNEV